ncbi:Methyltransferase type 11 [Caldicellulosiruptor saccharolyticus DSM 8903]|uniref:Methyltransferase type 11 n=1 Tax=Caldicellulosiruptor saccharolyticus (strain ATCC 43494 / DSM 8903 / Tp8T 6331) TaxID=351627 RepID=A4XGL8_CALS8|nr:class I SAM-dependent methyltransferase [Caldicellulosiruptor saccharolyticus]ABP66053.1 Methyltransferase type 11 [Caldicellulosiruptor saccharolyticus DSM 8903]
MKNKTEIIRKRYDRAAKYYDAIENMMEKKWFSQWRKLLFSYVKGPKVLEVGVGTGKNMPYYNQDWEIVAIDFSPKMLEKAKERSAKLNLQVDLKLMDVQNLEFADNSFDTVVTACVFCSVPDPILGLKEIRRVLKGDGLLVMLEHVRSKKEPIGKIMDILNPLVVGLYGANINRNTVENVKKAGFEIVEEKNLLSDIVKLIVAKPIK